MRLVYPCPRYHGTRSVQNGNRSFAGQKWVTGKGLVNDDSVAKRSAEPDTESFPWIPESEDDDDENNVASKRSREEDTQESFPLKVLVRETLRKEPYESFPGIH